MIGCLHPARLLEFGIRRLHVLDYCLLLRQLVAKHLLSALSLLPPGVCFVQLLLQ